MKLLEFLKQFPDEELCIHYIKNQREKCVWNVSTPDATIITCNKSNNRWVCAECGSRTTLTSKA